MLDALALVIPCDAAHTAQLPDGISVGKDARTAFAAAARVFVSYATAAFAASNPRLHAMRRSANDIAQAHSRKTLTAADVLAAMQEIEFAEFEPTIKKALERARIRDLRAASRLRSVFAAEQAEKKAEAQKRRAQREGMDTAADDTGARRHICSIA